jgi:transposase
VGVAIGVDSHKRTLAAAAVDELGRSLGAREFPNDPAGHRRMLGWVRTFEGDRRIGVEGSGTYGAGLVRTLVAAGEETFEVPASLTFRERRRRGSQGKSDPVDALAIARVVARGEELPWATRTAVCADLKALSDYRDQLVRSRTQVANRVHRDLAILRPGYQGRVANLTAKRNLSRAASILKGDRSVRADLIRRRLAELRRLDAEAARTKAEIVVTLEQSGTTLTEVPGMGPLLAARILGEVGDPRRIRSKAAFAQMAGTAPLPASSGATSRHRLNRGGNRKLNHALHYMALVRYRFDPDTRAYVQRRRQEGKSFREAMRCLKRHLSNVVYRRMVADLASVSLAT